MPTLEINTAPCVCSGTCSPAPKQRLPNEPRSCFLGRLEATDGLPTGVTHREHELMHAYAYRLYTSFEQCNILQVRGSIPGCRRGRSDTRSPVSQRTRCLCSCFCGSKRQPVIARRLLCNIHTEPFKVSLPLSATCFSVPLRPDII